MVLLNFHCFGWMKSKHKMHLRLMVHAMFSETLMIRELPTTSDELLLVAWYTFLSFH